MAKYIKKIFSKAMSRALPFLAGLIFALFCFILINAAMEPVSASHYCGGSCHEMHRALHTWKESVHGGGSKGLQAECVDCHLPEKDDFFRHVIVKAYAGGKDMYKHYMNRWFGTTYEQEKVRIEVLDRMSNEKCTRCHVDLLSKPGNEIIRDAHMEALKTGDDVSRVRCVECHEDAGHQRESKEIPLSTDE